MKVNIGCVMKYFGSECMKNNLETIPQRIVIDKELLKAEDCPNPNYLNSEKAVYLLT